jgi:hypothetical protein
VQPFSAGQVYNKSKHHLMKGYSLLTIFALILSTTLTTAQRREARNVDSFSKINFGFAGTLYLKQGSPQKVELEGDEDILKRIETEVSGGKLRIGTEDKWLRRNLNGQKITVYITVPEIKGIAVSGSGNVVGQSTIQTDDLDLNVSGSGSLKIDFDAKGAVDADVSGSGDLDINGNCKRFDSDVSGSGRVNLSGKIADTANFGISGSGKIYASGSADVVKTDISGSGKVLASDLQANRCEVRISGSGDVEINVQEELNANISGSGSVRYKGNPNHVNANSAGSGKVRKM